MSDQVYWALASGLFVTGAIHFAYRLGRLHQLLVCNRLLEESHAAQRNELATLKSKLLGVYQ